jgi:hypothetical protein
MHLEVAGSTGIQLDELTRRAAPARRLDADWDSLPRAGKLSLLQMSRYHSLVEVLGFPLVDPDGALRTLTQTVSQTIT